VEQSIETRNKPCTSNQVNFDKGGIKSYIGENIVCLINGAGKIKYPYTVKLIYTLIMHILYESNKNGSKTKV
jgi:hypothetical protein